MTPRSHYFGFLPACLATLLFLGAGRASGQTTITWGGSTLSWNVGSNWVGGFAPGPSDTAQITTGSPSVDSAVSIVGILFSGGTITGPASLTLTGTGSTWTGGTMTGPGATNIATGGTLAINTGNPTLQGRNLNNAGTVSFAPANYLTLTGSGTLANLAGGLWNFQNNSVFNLAGTWAFHNQAGATLRKSTTSGTLSFNLPLTNAGTVDILGGVFSLDNGGSATGTFTLDPSATLRFNSDFTLGAGASFSPTGLLQLASGTLTLARGSAFVPTTNFSFTGGTLTGTDDFNTGLGLTTTWTGGTMTGPGATNIATGGTLAINTGNPTLQGRNLNNAGTVSFAPANYLTLTGSGTLANLAGGLWNFQNNSVFNLAGSWAFHNQAGATLRKSTTSGTLSFNLPLTNAGTVDILGGVFSLDNGGSATGTFTLDPSATLRFNSDFTLGAGASFSPTGLLQLASGTLTLARGSAFVPTTNFSFTGGTLTGTDDFNTGLGLTTTWTGGTMSGPGATNIATGGTLAINTGNPTLQGRNLTNAGTVSFAPANYLTLTGSGTLANLAGGLWNFQNNSVFNLAGSWAFHNQAGATLRKSTTSGTLSFNLPLTNAGTVDILGGVFSLDNGGSATGTFTLDPSATLRFNSDFTLGAGASFSPTGLLQLASGTLTLARGSAFVPTTNFSFTGGTLTGTDDFNTGLGLTTTWTGGTMTGPGATNIATGGTLAINTGNPTLQGRNLTNAGTVSFAPANYLTLTGSGTLANLAGGLWNFQNNSVFNLAGTWAFHNQAGATLRKSTTSGTLSFNLPLTNAGTVDILGGVFSLDNGGSATGTFTLDPSATLRFNSDFTLGAGASLSPTGSLQLTSGTLTLASGFTFGPTELSFSGGTLTGAGAWEIPLASTHFWSGGTLSGTGATIVRGELTIAGGNPTISGRTITNQGLVFFAPANYLTLSGNVAFINAPSAFFDLAGDQAFNRSSGTHTFDNQAGATLVKSAGAGIFDFSLPVTNAGQIIVNSGTLRFSSTFTHTGGVIMVTDGATAEFSSGLNLSGGVLTGSGTIIGNVTSSGLITPGSSPGQLNINGNLSLLATSATLFELGGTAQGTGYDFLNVSGTASLGGSLQLTFVNSFQSTVLPSNTFTLLSANLLTGTFANVPTSGLRIFTTDGLGSFQVDYTGITLNLSNFAPVPEPSTWVLLALGTSLLGILARRRH